jgi:predicted secreted protein
MRSKAVTAVGLMVSAAAALADTAPPQNVLSLAAQASVEVQQDLLQITLSTTRDGADAGSVQTQLRQALDAALAEARKAAKPGQVDVRTGNFAMNPRYTNKGGINGWQGTAELVLEGRDFAAIGALTGRITTLTVARIGYGLSREAREKVEADASAQAIARFRAKAADYARQFGFGGYTLREINVGGGEQQHQPVPMVRARAMSMASADESQPLEAGKTTVVVTVNGSIVLGK